MSLFSNKLPAFTLSPQECGVFLITPEAPDFSFLRNCFSSSIGCIGILKVKYQNLTTNTGSVTLSCTDCSKVFKLKFFYSSYVPGQALSFEVTSKDSRFKCECLPKTPQLRGAERVQVKEQLKRCSPSQLHRASLTAPLHVNSPPVTPKIVFRNALQELRRENDMDTVDPINDAYHLMSSGTCQNIQEVSLYQTSKGKRFRVILLSTRAISFLQSFLLDGTVSPLKRLLLDATGKVTKKIYESAVLHHVLLAVVPRRTSGQFMSFAVAELVTDDQTGENIGYFLRFALSRLSAASLSRLKQIGTDDSWANLNAIMSLSETNVLRFLQLSYEVFIGKPASKNVMEIVSPALCFSHLSKNWSKDLLKTYGKEPPKRRHMVRAVLTQMTLISNCQELERYIKSFLALLCSKFQSPSLTAAKLYLSQSIAILDEESFEDGSIDQPTEARHKVFYKDSPFYQKFNTLAEGFLESGTNGEPNSFYNYEFVQKFLKHYVAILPLWTIFIAKLHDDHAERSNNARVERYFRTLKDLLEKEAPMLTRLSNIRLGRYAAFQTKVVESSVNELEAESLCRAAHRTNQPRKRRLAEIKEESSDEDDTIHWPTHDETKKIDEQWNKQRRTKWSDRSSQDLKNLSQH